MIRTPATTSRERGIGAATTRGARGIGAAETARGVVEVVPLVMRRIRGEMRAHAGGVSIQQFRALVFLERHAGASLGELAAFLGVTDATASVLVQRMVGDGIARRADRSGQRRTMALTLTPHGARLLGRARTTTRARVAATLGTLRPRELATVNEALLALARVFGEAGDGAVAAGDRADAAGRRSAKSVERATGASRRIAKVGHRASEKGVRGAR